MLPYLMPYRVRWIAMVVVALASALTKRKPPGAVRMYLNGRPSEDLRRVFGVTTFEFG